MIFVNSAQETNNKTNDLDENAPLTEGEVTLAGFWPSITDEIKRIKTVDAKNQVLPLARIKKIMKLDEDVKMISAEAPLLFAKAAEIFIHELTLRAWIHTENNKRRTLQRNDIAMAITKYDQFDFLIDIVPREEVKPVPRKEPITKTNCDQVQYYLQLAQQHQQALQGTNNIASSPTVTVQPNTNSLNTIQLPTGQLATPITTINGTPQNILVTNTGQQIATSVNGATLMNNLNNLNNLSNLSNLNNLGGLQAAAQQNHAPIQLVQQIVGPNGEIQHMPITIPQNLLRMQVQNQNNSQPIIISASSLQNQPQILQMAQSPPSAGIFLNHHNTTNEE